MPVSRYSTESIDARRRRGVVADMVWYWALAMVGTLLLVGVAAATAAVSPAYCGTCHEAQRTELAQSTHESLDCDSCHVDPGLLGLVDNRVAVAGMLPAKLVPVFNGPRLPVSNAACNQCHLSINTGVVVANGLRMSHKELTTAGWLCTECHSDVAHVRPPAAPTGRYTMGMCLECHSSNSQNLQTCDVCHDNSVPAVETTGQVSPWQATHGPQWETTHGMGELTTCKACHPTDYCVRCHSMAIPHPANFAARHGDSVVESPESRKDCLVCHKGSSCENCHGIEMPHPSGFLKQHPSVVKAQGKRVCTRCHDEASCDGCHKRHIHPGVPAEHRKALESRPVSAP